MSQKDVFHEEVEKLIEAIEQLKFDEPITRVKFRIGSSQYWILSKKKPKQKVIAYHEVYISGEIVPGWWLWTY